MSTLRNLLITLADHWLPRACALCDSPLAATQRGLCSFCAGELPGSTRARCACCALPQATPTECCMRCQACPPPWRQTLVLADYAPPLDRLVVALKFRGELQGAAALGELLGQRLARAVQTGLVAAPDALVPIPLGAMRLAARGYNQAEAMAQRAGRTFGVRVRGAWLARTRDTPAQSELALPERERNLAGAFVADPAVRGRHVVLVDDVMTSGATLKAAAAALRAQGAASVINLVVARTP